MLSTGMRILSVCLSALFGLVLIHNTPFLFFSLLPSCLFFIVSIGIFVCDYYRFWLIVGYMGNAVDVVCVSSPLFFSFFLRALLCSGFLFSWFGLVFVLDTDIHPGFLSAGILALRE